jgi:hypothetical protein
MQMQGSAGSPSKRRFKILLSIYLGVNAILIATWAVLTAAGGSVAGPFLVNLTIYIVAMALWGVYVLIQGINAYRSHP